MKSHKALLNIYKIGIFIPILILTIVNYLNLDDNWENKTNSLIESSTTKTEGLYNDISYKFDIKPNIYDTYYLLEMISLLNIEEEHNLEAYINLLTKELNNTNDIIDLITIYKINNILDLNIDIVPQILCHDKFTAIERELLSAEDNILKVVNNVLLIHYIPELIDKSILNNTNDCLRKYASKAINEQEIIFILNKIKDIINIEDIINANSDAIVMTSVNRINYILNTNNYLYLEELYDIIELLITKNLTTANEIEAQCNISGLNDDISQFSNKQLLFYIKIQKLLNYNIAEYKEYVLKILTSCKNITGGYYPRILDDNINEITLINMIIQEKFIGVNVNEVSKKHLFYFVSEEILKNKANWRIINLYINFLASDNEKDQLYYLLTSRKETILESSINVWYYIKTLEQFNIEYDSNLLFELITYLEESILNNDLTSKISDYYYYSEIISENDFVNINPIVYNKIKEELQLTVNSNNIGFYKLNGLENLYTTYYCNKIVYNLNFVDLMIEDNETFLTKLYMYRTEYGGYTLVQDNTPTTLATYLGCLLEQINKEEFTYISY